MARGQRQETVKTFVGTPCWMAPEVMEQLEGYDYRADIWSIGITALELAKGMAPYAKYPPMRVLVLTIEEDPPSLKSYDNDRQRTGAPFSRMYEDFVRKCLQKTPKSRPSAEELLKHKFFKGRAKDALLHQLLDHLPAVGAGEEPDQDDGELSGGSAGGSFFRDAGSIGSKSSSNTQDLELHSVDSTSQQHQQQQQQSTSSGTSVQQLQPGVSKVSFNNSVDETKSETSTEKDFVSGTTWVFDSSLGESGVFSTSGEEEADQDGSRSGGRGRRDARRHLEEEDEDDLGDFMDGFDRETATMKTSLATASGDSGRDRGGSHEAPRTRDFVSDDGDDNQYNLPREGSAVLDCASLVSSLNSLSQDDVVTGLLSSPATGVLRKQAVGGAGGGGREEDSKLLGAAKENIFEFDDQDHKRSEEFIALAGGSLKPGPLLNSMDNRMVSSLDGNEALERLIGSGLYPKPAASSSSSSPSLLLSPKTRQQGGEHSKDRESCHDEEEEEDLDVFLDGFEEETADMNF